MFSQASAFAATERAALRIERRSAGDLLAAQTLGGWVERYRQDVVPQKKSKQQDDSICRMFTLRFPDLCARAIVNLKPSDFGGHDARSVRGRLEAAELKPSTIVRWLAVLSHVFTTAQEWGFEVTNPVLGVAKLVVDNARERTLTPLEWERVDASWGDIRREVVAAIRWLWWTAVRRSEAIRLDWSDLDFSAHPPTAHLRNTKGSYRRKASERWIPLPAKAVEALNELASNHWPSSGSVFGGIAADSLTQAFARACARAEVEGATVHDLRHTRTTELALALPLQALAKLTGHSSPAMLMRYYNVKRDQAMETGRAIEAYEAALVKGKGRKRGSARVSTK